jgi:hypothetical protein
MDVLTPFVGPLNILFEALSNSKKTVEQINQSCLKDGLPLAFPINKDGNPNIPGDSNYRFEGFGIIVLPPQLSFWVHYKSDTSEHREIGQFTVPIGFDKIAHLKLHHE